jgi:hypothetical protein
MQLFNGEDKFSLIYSIGGKWAVVPYLLPYRGRLNILPNLLPIAARKQVYGCRSSGRVFLYEHGTAHWDHTKLACGLSSAGFSNKWRRFCTPTLRDAINQCRDSRMVILTRGKWWSIDLNVSNEKVLINL